MTSDFLTSDINILLKKAGITTPNQSQNVSFLFYYFSELIFYYQFQNIKKDNNNTDEDFDCSICFDTKPKSQFFSLACNHIFCIDCWIDYLKV